MINQKKYNNHKILIIKLDQPFLKIQELKKIYLMVFLKLLQLGLKILIFIQLLKKYMKNEKKTTTIIRI